MMALGAFWRPLAHRMIRGMTLAGLVLLSSYGSGAGAVAPEPVGSFVAALSPPKPKGEASAYQLIPATIDETSHGPDASQSLRLLAPMTRSARIVDQDGVVVRRSPDGGSIGSLTMSPSRQWLLLYFGDAEYSVVSADSLEDLVRPPSRPDGHDDATGIRWFVLDDDLLLGQASLPSLETEGLTASERDGLPPRNTLVFVYSISARLMEPVEIDSRFPTPFSIVDVVDGHVTLLTFVEDERLGARIIRSAEH